MMVVWRFEWTELFTAHQIEPSRGWRKSMRTGGKTLVRIGRQRSQMTHRAAEGEIIMLRSNAASGRVSVVLQGARLAARAARKAIDARSPTPQLSAPDGPEARSGPCGWESAEEFLRLCAAPSRLSWRRQLHQAFGNHLAL